MSPILLWYRNHDLRVHDHPALSEALQHAKTSNLPLYCFWVYDEASFPDGIGAHRLTFLLESVYCLQQKIKLDVLKGDTLEIILKLTTLMNTKHIYGTKHTDFMERQIERALASKINNVHLKWGHVLFQGQPTKDLPQVFTDFRKQIEANDRKIEVLDTPSKEDLDILLTGYDMNSEIEVVKNLSEIITSYSPEFDHRACLQFHGGEENGLARVKHYLWNSHAIETYKATRNGMLGPDYSTKFSAWLNTGSISPRYVWNETLKFEKEFLPTESTYWVRFELLWREFFQWVALKAGAKLFAQNGFKDFTKQAENIEACTISGINDILNRESGNKFFKKWSTGNTGCELVDANMREINATGFMSNRGRQNVASYLIHDLKLDWRVGAAYFQKLLIDYNAGSNWGNWAYIAGVGNDPRPFRKFNLEKQTNQYDKQAVYRTHWLGTNHTESEKDGL